MSNNQTHGFTLIEILIAMFIFTILSIMMAGALHSIINLQSGADRTAERLRNLQMVIVRVSRDLEQTVNRPVKTSNNQDASAFFGNEHGFAFTHGGMAGRPGYSTLERTEYICGKKGFYRMAWDVLDLAEKSPKPSQRLLLENVTDGYFEYMDDKQGFHKDWPVKDGSSSSNNKPLPRAVRMTLTIQDWGTIRQTYVIPAENPTDPTQAAAAPAGQGGDESGAPQGQDQPTARPTRPDVG